MWANSVDHCIFFSYVTYFFKIKNGGSKFSSNSKRPFPACWDIFRVKLNDTIVTKGGLNAQDQYLSKTLWTREN